MSRNLGTSVCNHCGHAVVALEEAHPITPKEAGRYFREYEGMIVAEAECPICLSHYLAWVDCSKRVNYAYTYSNAWGVPVDLSYYASFNDEPGTDQYGRFDGPQFEVQKIETWHRVSKITR